MSSEAKSAYRRIGRRTRFFAVLLVIGLVMVPATPTSFEGAAWFVVIASGFWALLFLLEDLLTPVPPVDRPDRGRRPEAPSAEALFAPPPPRRAAAERRRQP
jgi:hypothetical protein